MPNVLLGYTTELDCVRGRVSAAWLYAVNKDELKPVCGIPAMQTKIV